MELVILLQYSHSALYIAHNEARQDNLIEAGWLLKLGTVKLTLTKSASKLKI